MVFRVETLKSKFEDLYRKGDTFSINDLIESLNDTRHIIQILINKLIKEEQITIHDIKNSNGQIIYKVIKEWYE